MILLGLHWIVSSNSSVTPQNIHNIILDPIILHEEEMPPEQKHVTTYEELRKKNRDEYEQKRVQTYR